ncbi:activator of basal transcription 1, partial [Lagopus leucura]|uniref:activator of basal transcription 1 n=1 Tax=Lagopus leucura TaxID=30410 RepID=UPI001C66B08A
MGLRPPDLWGFFVPSSGLCDVTTGPETPPLSASLCVTLRQRRLPAGSALRQRAHRGGGVSAMAVAERSVAEEGEEEASAELETSEPEVAEEKPEAEEKQRKKVPVPGVVYLSHVPPGFGPRQLRTLLGGHGELGRVFLQPR